MGPVIVHYATNIVGVLALIIISFMVAGWVQRLVQRTLEKRSIDRALAGFLGSMARWSIVTLAIIASLGVFGVETTSFAAVIGAAGLAIGLAFQGSLSNLAAGVMLLIFRPFKSDDVVSVAGETGKIDMITLFTTTMDTVDNRRVIIPNAQVFGSVIVNLTFHDKRRADVNVGTDYGADLDETRKVLEEAAKSISTRLDDPGHQIVLVSLGDSAVNWQVRIWCATENYFPTLEETTRAVKQQLDGAKISIPFPQMDVHLDK